MSPQQLAAKIDHTLLKPEATLDDVRKIATEANDLHCASACISPVFVTEVAKMLAGSGVKTCTVVGFPSGAGKGTVKAIEATVAVKDGADEIDVVAHLPHLLAGDLTAAKTELTEIVRAARAARRDVVVKVIVESACLMKLAKDGGEQAIATACAAVRESGCDFIKTSTGFHPAGGASIEAVKLMKKHGQGLQIKAAGGIRDLATALAMLEAGADRLGMSASVAVIDELRKSAK